jgi:hypothetical protein
MTLPIAHAGHWIADLLYLLPLAIALGFLGVQAIRDRNDEEAERSQPADEPPPV